MHEADRWLRLEQSNLLLEILWQHHVILMKETEELAAGQFQTTIPVPANSQTLGVLMHMEPRVAIGTDDVQGAIFRAVIDHHQLEVLERLRQDALYGFDDKLLAVAGR